MQRGSGWERASARLPLCKGLAPGKQLGKGLLLSVAVCACYLSLLRAETTFRVLGKRCLCLAWIQHPSSALSQHLEDAVTLHCSSVRVLQDLLALQLLLITMHLSCAG